MVTTKDYFFYTLLSIMSVYALYLIKVWVNARRWLYNEYPQCMESSYEHQITWVFATVAAISFTKKIVFSVGSPIVDYFLCHKKYYQESEERKDRITQIC